jgi:hypothetical protein
MPVSSHFSKLRVLFSSVVPFLTVTTLFAHSIFFSIGLAHHVFIALLGSCPVANFTYVRWNPFRFNKVIDRFLTIAFTTSIFFHKKKFRKNLNKNNISFLGNFLLYLTKIQI